MIEFLRGLLEILIAGLLLTGAGSLVLAAIDKVREWDRASLGLVAGTHDKPAPKTIDLSGHMLRITLAAEPFKKAMNDVAVAANNVEIRFKQLEFNQASLDLYYGNKPFTIRDQAALDQVDVDFIRNYYAGEAPAHITTAIRNLGAGKLKLTYTEGTIND